VTGGAQGIGLANAEALIAHGRRRAGQRGAARPDPDRDDLGDEARDLRIQGGRGPLGRAGLPEEVAGAVVEVTGGRNLNGKRWGEEQEKGKRHA
jgi:hypothetical protein